MPQLEKNFRPLADIHDVRNADVNDPSWCEETLHPRQFSARFWKMFKGVVENDEIEASFWMRLDILSKTSGEEVKIVKPFRHLHVYGGEFNAFDPRVGNLFLDEMQQRAETAADIQHPDA